MSQRRRRRKAIRPEHDEADDLFQLLLEQAAPSTPKQWFEAPWRSGLHAIKLGADLLAAMIPHTKAIGDPVFEAINFASAIEEHAFESLYWDAQNLKEVNLTQVVSASLVNNALELVQKFAARSDGGGVGSFFAGFNISLSFANTGAPVSVSAFSSNDSASKPPVNVTRCFRSY